MWAERVRGICHFIGSPYGDFPDLKRMWPDGRALPERNSLHRKMVLPETHGRWSHRRHGAEIGVGHESRGRSKTLSCFFACTFNFGEKKAKDRILA